ncbi:thiamine phosphate synthase [Ramlibacter sp. H39-3-26]|uniref:thiamine phosphate synthase n=1 Tax=Curvibacter soli TaxID=3031331 RepID=UPI0023DA9FCE|nr:thiamine phosphate synthase [Ramlibacter sp. H39-3-26]MDF1485684.1 thiamine phosphate synthase [Ramlibacter sp. H39-3-26]
MAEAHDTDALAARIAQAHGTRFAGFPAQPAPAPTLDDPVYRAALRAASVLGFIATDAETIARAWSAQTARTGAFDAAAWPGEPVDFGLQPLPRAHAFPACPQRLGLYAVLPSADWVGRMARAGVPTVQLRFKSADPAAVAREVRAAVQAVRGTHALLFINDHWQAAIDAGAYGVHLGQEDLDGLPGGALDALRAAGLRLGLSTHGYAEMQRADAVGPSYIAMGAVFPTTLKKMPTAPQGMARLAAYAGLLRHYPRVAIGGIDAARFQDVLATGVGSIAVVRALVAAPDPEQAAHELLALLSCI